ncbi:MAG: hypothetical protein Fur0010_04840 [Bdellovibrio sp.]
MMTINIPIEDIIGLVLKINTDIEMIEALNAINFVLEFLVKVLSKAKTIAKIEKYILIFLTTLAS